MFNAALIGLPNAGKTTIFNALTGEHAKTGNWHGVTVDGRSAKIKGADTVLYDLPGVYSLAAFSPEEKVTESFVKNNRDCLFLSAVPAADLERGVKTTLALAAQGLKTALVLTFYDEFVKNGGKLDLAALEKKLGVPAIAINGNRKADIKRLKAFIAGGADFTPRASATNFDLSDAFTPPEYREKFIDKILLNKYACGLCFVLAVAAVFFVTFGKNSLGAYLQTWVQFVMQYLAQLAEGALVGAGCPAALSSFLSEGVIIGAGSVMSFIPQLLLMYFFLTVMEESGFMARIAFAFDGVFKKLGLNGRAVFSVFMGFGCTAIAELSTRALDNDALKKKTALALPFVSCSARLPVYLVVINSFFTKSKVLILLLVYFGGLCLSALTAALLGKYVYKEKQTFIMEMPDMRAVGIKKVAKALLYYAKQFIMKVGGVIMLVLAALWFLKSFSPSFGYVGDDVSASLLAAAGRIIKYLFYPMGVSDWRLGVSVISGLFAKEAIVGTLGLLCPEGIAALLTPAQALAFLAFTALYTPCLSAMSAMRKEIGLKAAVLSGLSTFAFALIVGYAVYFFALLTEMAYVKPVIYIIAALVLLAAAVKTFTKNKCAACGKCKGKNERNCIGKGNKAR